MFEGKLVRLRAYKIEDAERACEFMNDPEITRLIMPHVPHPISLEEEREWVKSLSSNNKGGAYTFAVEVIEGSVYIGSCSVFRPDWKNSHATVGIMIGDKNYQGRGYGTEAMKLLLDYIFMEMGLNRVELEVYGYNERAIKSYEKNGFTREGVRRKALFKNGEYHDIVVMGILKDEYFCR